VFYYKMFAIFLLDYYFFHTYYAVSYYIDKCALLKEINFYIKIINYLSLTIILVKN